MKSARTEGITILFLRTQNPLQNGKSCTQQYRTYETELHSSDDYKDSHLLRLLFNKITKIFST